MLEMLRIAEIIVILIVGIQLILMILLNWPRHLLTYSVVFIILLVVEQSIVTMAGFTFFDKNQGVTWIYVVCIFLNAGMSHLISGRLGQKFYQLDDF